MNCICEQVARADGIIDAVDLVSLQVIGVVSPVLDRIEDPDDRRVFLATLLASLLTSSSAAVCDDEDEADAYDAVLSHLIGEFQLISQ